jgi:formiminotetrahydrofolate cyclodeaminase
VTSFPGQTLTAFAGQAAARQPAPGGGSAAALTATLAAGLTAMAARFSATQVGNSEELAIQVDQLRRRGRPGR